MALVKYGAGITQMSGSIAGNTFARNRFGNYVRSRTKPVNPNTEAQSQIRSALTFLSQAWKDSLTDAQRLAWSTYAAAVAMTNRLGEVTYLTGFNHFLRSNIQLVKNGESAVVAGPTTLSLPEKDATLQVSASVAAGKLSFAIDDTMEWCDENGAYMFIFMGEPQNPTRNFFAGPWKYAGAIAGDSVSPPTSPQVVDPPYNLVEGQRVFAYASLLRADGRLSNPMYTNCVVAA